MGHQRIRHSNLRIRRQWGMPMGGWGMPMGGFGGPMGGWGGMPMPMPMSSRSHGHASKFTSIQMPFFSLMSGSTSGQGASSFIGKK
uniref:Uncharacterized protein n=1 Tax=Panagrolaimus superbus TaxID=310955 RepID=A0A914YEZ7_9BILA